MKKSLNEYLLQVKDLKTYFDIKDGEAKAVDGVSFNLKSGETLGIVGESGCGKSVTALSILRLIPSPPGKIVGGEILFNGQNLLALSNKELRNIRGNRISMIFQEPMTSLNPLYTIGDQISEVLLNHKKISKKEATEFAIEMLNKVRIPEPRKRIDEYPHQMSGGMRQRVMIAAAMICNPDILIADEPTTALDVTVQAQILELMRILIDEFKSSVIIISHDLGVIANIADTVAVMYAGMIVEQATVNDLFDNPLHPYTKALMESIPKISEIHEKKQLNVIKGNVPDPANFPQGCRFHPRCPMAVAECKKYMPKLREIKENHFARCIRLEIGGEMPRQIIY